MPSPPTAMLATELVTKIQPATRVPKGFLYPSPLTPA
jgi:hypothetical protein